MIGGGDCVGNKRVAAYEARVNITRTRYPTRFGEWIDERRKKPGVSAVVVPVILVTQAAF